MHSKKYQIDSLFTCNRVVWSEWVTSRDFVGYVSYLLSMQLFSSAIKVSTVITCTFCVMCVCFCF